MNISGSLDPVFQGSVDLGIPGSPYLRLSGSLILWNTRSNKFSAWSSLLSATAMGAVVIYHAVGIFDAAYL